MAHATVGSDQRRVEGADMSEQFSSQFGIENSDFNAAALMKHGILSQA